MRAVTVDIIMAAKPCDDYPRERVEELFAGRAELTLEDLFALDIPAADRWWVFTVCYVATEREYRLIACDIADEIAMPIWRKLHPNDDRPQLAIDTVRRYANGLATDTEIAAARAAARTAERTAQMDVARAAARAAAWTAVKDTGWMAAMAVAMPAARATAIGPTLAAGWKQVFGIARRYK